MSVYYWPIRVQPETAFALKYRDGSSQVTRVCGSTDAVWFEGNAHYVAIITGPPTVPL